jgi:hypothetical protein
MAVKILSKQGFADLAGVSAAAVTKAAATILSAAIVGSRIDANHPVAVKYLQEHARDKNDVATDPLLLSASRACKEANSYTDNFLRKKFSIGAARAKRLLSAIKSYAANEVVNEITKAATIEEAIEAATSAEPKPRGRASARETKIREYQDLPPIEYEGEIIDLANFTLRELIAKFGTDIRFMDWLDALKKIEDIDEKQIKNAKLKGELISQELVKVVFIDPVVTGLTQLLTDCSKTMSMQLPPMVLSGADEHEVELFIRGQLSTYINRVKDKMQKGLKSVLG